MTSLKTEAEDPQVRRVRPVLPERVKVLINAFIETKRDHHPKTLAEHLRGLETNWGGEDWSLQLRAVALVIADLLDQGWGVTPTDDAIELVPPGLLRTGETVEGAKLRLQQALRVGRDRQLDEPSVRAFLEGMNRRVRRAQGFTSVNDLIDDGGDLADRLEEIAGLPQADAEARLAGLVDPVVEACDEGVRCPETGLRLLDVWRYFRHTWSLEYRSIPGRQLPLLVRNRVRRGRPVIGIAMLASPVFRLSARDAGWLAWTTPSFLASLREGRRDPRAAMGALRRRVDAAITELRHDDLLADAELEAPTERLIYRLEQKSAGAAERRGRELREKYEREMEENGQATSDRGVGKQNLENTDWRAASEDALFVRKRAETLAQLLIARMVFNEIDWGREDLVDQVLRHTAGERALAYALQEVRKAGLASQVVDVSVCGAVAPYNVLLGGKLVAMLMASTEVRALYRDRYSGATSIIASQMAGRAIRRTAEIKAFTTTSLYGNGSSQYNRLNLRTADHPELMEDIAWREFKHTKGFGTFHLSADTIRVLRDVSQATARARRVNHLFGEGTSPRMRQVREGLDALGMQSDQILKHDMPRLLYGLEAHEGALDELLGLTPPTVNRGSSAAAIGTAWRRRWLLGRVRNAEVLDRLRGLGPHTVRAELRVPDEGEQFILPFPSQP